MAPVGMPDSARRVVVKIGSNLLVNSENGQLRFDWLKGLAADVAFELASGREVILVSSGSIALGRSVLGFPQDESLALEQSQAAAAVGQIRLAQAYEEALAPHDIVAAQVLLTLDDSDNRRRFLNSRATINALLGYHGWCRSSTKTIRSPLMKSASETMIVSRPRLRRWPVPTS